MKSFIKKQLAHDVHPVVQFIKYGIVGGMSTVLHAVAFFLLAWLFFPCLKDTDPAVKLLSLSVEPMTDGARALNALFCTVIGFTISNVFCYFLNRLFVFKPGKHHVILEFLLFYGVSAISQVVSLSLQTVLISSYGMQTSYAFGANIICALLINYATRKFLIFKS